MTSKTKPKTAVTLFVSKPKSFRHSGTLSGLLASAERVMSEGRALLALPLLEQASTVAPHHPDVQRLLAVRALLLSSHDEALVHAQQACRLDPSRGDLRMVLGRALKAAGRLDEALESYRSAVNLNPRLAEAHVSLGIALKGRGQLSDAIACYRQALAINPQLAAAHANLGNALLMQAEQLASDSDAGASLEDEAAGEAQRLAVELDPGNVDARANWARSLDRAGRSQSAVEVLNTALGLEPNNEDVCLALIGVLFNMRSFEAARDILSRWIPANPGRRANTVNCLSTALLHLDRMDEALEWARKAEHLAPEDPDIQYNIASVLINRLQVPQALGVFLKIIGLAPSFVMARQSLLLCLNYVETDPLRIVQAHRAFGSAITRDAPAGAPPLAPLRPKPRLRVGYLSGDLRRHSVGYFIESMFAAHDPERVELVAYHNSRQHDEVSERLKSHCSSWVACHTLTDDQLLRRIRRDQIDVLIDLSGPTADARSEVFAMRAAPVQVSYLGYPTTTGIPAMDFRISDASIDPPGQEAQSTEVVLRCASGMFCFRPDHAGDVGQPPVMRNGFVTFGSFNNVPKYSDRTLALWAQVLLATPGSRLLLKTKAVGDPEVQRLLRARFAELGLASERLLLNTWRPDLQSHLELYREVDVALDSFPYNGATTTCEALWAGVPVVTLRGQTHASRMGASILRALGRAEWIAADVPQFVDIARALADSPQALATFRASARDCMRASPLMAAAAHTREFEDLLFKAWEMRSDAHARGVDPAAGRAAVAEGDALFEQGQLEPALEAFKRAVAILPTDLHAHWGLARTLTNMEKVDPAIEALRDLVALDSSGSPVWFLLGGMYKHQGSLEQSRLSYDRAYALAPSDAILVCRDLLLPSIVPFGTNLPTLRLQHEQCLQALIERPIRLADPLVEVSAGAMNEYFRLAYHGLSNRRLHEHYARLMLKACPELAWTAPHLQDRAPSRRGDARIRIGFISRFFRQHSIGKTSVGLIEQLDRSQFHVTALFIPPRRDDPMANRIALAADEAVKLPAGLEASREAIAALELDVLFYQDIGMEPHSYYLAFARLAPVQCVSFGHPDTTGIPNMDAWISSEGFEPPGAQADYSERLVLLPALGTLAYYERPVLLPGSDVGRAGFGLPENVPLLACPQALFKLHPDMDDLLAAILRRLPDAKLLFVEGDVPSYKQQLMSRWQARGDGIEHAAMFFPPLEHQSFLALFSLADVVLDTVHFNGMNSTLEALAMGAPVVTLPKLFQRGRHTLGMYRCMGYTDLVARDESHYADLVVRLVNDSLWRAEVRDQILSRCGVLFNDKAVVRAFEQAFVELVGAAESCGLPALAAQG